MLVVCQLIRIHTAFYEAPRFITTFTSVNDPYFSPRRSSPQPHALFLHDPF